VQRALRIGFTLAELAEVLKARDAGGAPCRRVYQFGQDKLNDIEADIEALKRTRRYMKNVLCNWKRRIESAGSGERLHLLYSLIDAVMSCLSWKWRKRSSVKITERTYEEGTEAFHPRRKSSGPEAASCGQSTRLGAV
jgi:hypothetical protein